MPDHYDAYEIANDLGDCRQRGLDWLDRRTSNQVPVRATVLHRLAEEYAEARRLVAAGRIAQIKILLRDGIDELSQQGHTTDARLLNDLFFGDSTRGAIKPPVSSSESLVKESVIQNPAFANGVQTSYGPLLSS